jgi:hypothetical protein
MSKEMRLRALTILEILSWADAYKEAAGKWPSKSSGPIAATKFESWSKVDNALRVGLRGLPGGSSLAILLADKRGVRNIRNLPKLSVELILKWADHHFEKTGKWPTRKSGKVLLADSENWQAIDVALTLCARGFTNNTSLPQLLATHRGVRNRKKLPSLSEEHILAWADARFQRTGSWPTGTGGPIAEAPGETWTAVNVALSHGQRGLPGGSSLPMLLAEKRGARNTWTIPALSIEQILMWADAYHQRFAKWPNLESGSIAETENETWNGINQALKKGYRGLQGGLSLARLLASERGARNPSSLPPLNLKLILRWADAYRKRMGTWPTKESGSIPESNQETWSSVDAALRVGNRGLQKGSSLARLLSEFRDRRNPLGLPRLSFKKILAWADAHFARTGKWPNRNSGPIQEAPGETWKNIEGALWQGHRGLLGGTSLLRLLARKRGHRNPVNLPHLTEKQVLTWATEHLKQTGQLPGHKDGSIVGSHGESWATVDYAFRKGKRGLTGYSSLAQFLRTNKGQLVSETVFILHDKAALLERAKIDGI